MIVHQGGCHCGRVRFEVRAAPDINVSECNCSICYKSGMLGLIVLPLALCIAVAVRRRRWLRLTQGPVAKRS